MWPFKRKAKRDRIQPMFPFQRAMKAKDPSLYERIKHLPVTTACKVWRSVHAEDFPQNQLYVYWPHAAS